MKNLIKYQEGKLSWILWVLKRIEENLNLNSLTTGETGSGKSWFDLKFAYDLDKTFELRQIAFNFKQVMRIINSDWFNKKKIKIIIFEEIQTSISNREWQQLVNKLFNYLLSTYRHRNIILLMNSPYSDFIDSHTKKLIHVVFEVRGHNQKTKQVQVRPKILQYNSSKTKFYEHSLFVLRDGKIHKQVYLFMNKPPKHLIDGYEKMKLDFTTKLNKSISEELENLDNKDKPKPLKELNPDSMQVDLWEFVKSEGYVRQADLCKQLGEKLGKDIKLSQLNRNIMSMRKRGWDIRQFKQENGGFNGI